MLSIRSVSRSILRKQPSTVWLRAGRQIRVQHNSNGPHKEYFQDPSQYPSELNPGSQQNISSSSNRTANEVSTSTVKSLFSRASRSQQNKTNSTASISTVTAATSARSSFTRRALRTSLLIAVFGALGFATGQAVITWEYLQPPYERGTEEYEDIQEEIDILLDTAPICENLRSQGWFEDAPPSQLGAGHQHLINGTLSGVNGFTYKVFRHPDRASTAVVFFAGSGLEGAPDVLHNGALAAIMSEAYNIHIAPVYKPDRVENIGFRHELTMCDHDNPDQGVVYPDDIYTVIVETSELGYGVAEDLEQQRVAPILALYSKSELRRCDDLRPPYRPIGSELGQAEPVDLMWSCYRHEDITHFFMLHDGDDAMKDQAAGPGSGNKLVAEYAETLPKTGQWGEKVATLVKMNDPAHDPATTVNVVDVELKG